ncbi:alpha/beta hydrolase family protein [Yoonia litorea]|nr:hypothetical protein [Yoonia litorea]
MPDEISMRDAKPDNAFRVIGKSSYLWFEPRSPVLVVSFDNLATLDDPYPRMPWIARQVADLGFSILGVQSRRKDWFRGTDADHLIQTLSDQGFFQTFETVVFIGASMGAFAALNYAPLVSGARVLALSPQSTMNKRIAPFETRFPWAVKNSDWTEPAFIDAADAIPDIPSVTIVFDPFDATDKQHAMRMRGPHVQLAPVPNSTHEAVRTVMKAGAFDAMLLEFIEKGKLGSDFWNAMRQRKTVRKWARAFVSNLSQSHHPTMALRVYDHLIERDRYHFAMQARRELLEAHPELRNL